MGIRKFITAVLAGLMLVAFGVAPGASATPIVNPVVINSFDGTAYTAVMSADDSRLYAVDNVPLPSKKLRIINTATDTVITSLDLPDPGTSGGIAAHGIVISPDNKTLYVAFQGVPSVVYVIDISSENSPAIVGSIPVPQATRIAMSPDGSKLIVTATTQQTFSVIDTSTRTVTWTNPGSISSSISGQVFRNPEAVAFSPDGTRYVVGYRQTTNNQGVSGVVMFSTLDNSIVTSKTFSTSPTDSANHVVELAYSRDGNSLYVGTTAGSNWWLRKYDMTVAVNTLFATPIWEHDPATAATAAMGNLILVRESADSDTVYFTAYRGFRAVNATTGATISTYTFPSIQTDIRALAVPNDTSARFVYVANAYLNSGAGKIYRFGELDISPKSQRVAGPSGTAVSTVALTSTLSGSVTYTSTALPAGVSLNASTGQLTGNIGSIAADVVVTITASNGVASQTATVTFKDNVPATLSPATQTLSATVGTSFSSPALTQAGFSSTPTFSVHPALPAGLTINSSTGVISGTPTAAAGQSTFTISANGLDSATATFTLEVVAAQVTAQPSSAGGSNQLAETGSKSQLPITLFGLTLLLAGISLYSGSIALKRRATI